MCNYSEGVWNDGKAAALVDAMKALMENAKVSAEQAAKMLNLHTNPPEIVQAVLEALAQKES